MEKRLKKIEQRNKCVELDKAWETSWIRKIIISVLTYGVIVLFFLAAQLDKPFVNPIIPTIGFILSTSSLNWFKKMWIKYKK